MTAIRHAAWALAAGLVLTQAPSLLAQTDSAQELLQGF